MLELVVIILAFVLMYIFFLSEYKSDGIILEESFIKLIQYMSDFILFLTKPIYFH
jgi:hypothetical protein